MTLDVPEGIARCDFSPPYSPLSSSSPPLTPRRRRASLDIRRNLDNNRVMAFTQADLDAVRSAIAKGEKTVVFADRSTTYRSIAELLEAERRIEADLATRPKQSLGVATKGF